MWKKLTKKKCGVAINTALNWRCLRTATFSITNDKIDVNNFKKTNKRASNNE